MVKKVLFFNIFLVLSVFISAFPMKDGQDGSPEKGTAPGQCKSSPDKGSLDKGSPTKSPKRPAPSLTQGSPEKSPKRQKLFQLVSPEKVAPGQNLQASQDDSAENGIAPGQCKSSPDKGSIFKGSPTKSSKRPVLEQKRRSPSSSPKRRKLVFRSSATESVEFEPFNFTGFNDISPLNSPVKRKASRIMTPTHSPSKSPRRLLDFLSESDYLMHYFIMNIYEFGNKRDQLVSFIRELFTIKDGKLEISEEFVSKKPKTTAESESFKKYVTDKLSSVGIDSDLTEVIRFFCNLKLEYFKKLHDVRDQEMPDAFDHFDDLSGPRNGFAFVKSPRFTTSFSVDFVDEDEQISDHEFKTDVSQRSELYNDVKSVFSAIKRNEKYSDYLLGVDLGHFGSGDFNRDKQALAFVASVISANDLSCLHLVYYIVLNKCFVEKNQDFYVEIIAILIPVYAKFIELIKCNIKSGSLLSYDLKYTLLLAKKIEQLMGVKDSINLDSIVLIKDDHILDLVYEEKHKAPGQFHIAGGHFSQAAGSLVTEKIMQKDSAPKFIGHCEALTSCPACNISYVRFHVAEKGVVIGTKDSTLFPECIKSRCHEYFKILFAVASGCDCRGVECLIKPIKPKDSFYLFRHKRSFLDQFSKAEEFCIAEDATDHDLYVSMIVFKEDGLNVIWTCYLLGVYVVDWNEDGSYLNNPLFMDKKIDTASVDSQIYEAFNVSSLGQEDGEISTYYSFKDGEVEYCLIGLCNGIYLKIPKLVLETEFGRICAQRAKEVSVAREIKKVQDRAKRLATKAASKEKNIEQQSAFAKKREGE